MGGPAAWEEEQTSRVVIDPSSFEEEHTAKRETPAEESDATVVDHPIFE